MYDYITIQVIWFITDYDYYEFYTNPFFITMCYLVCIGVAMLFGDIILRTLEGVRPIETADEREYLIPLFEDVCGDVKEVFPEMPKTKLYIIDNQTVNAQAIGKKTVAVTQGAISTFSRDELKAIIAHEMGHIYYGNTKAVLLNTIGNGIFSILVMVLRFILIILDFLQSPFEKQTKGLLHLLLDFVGWIVNSLEFLFLFVGNIILMGNSRSAEYTADKFAYTVGYGKELKESLYIMQKMSLTDQLKIIERLQASHPRVSRRIMKVEQLLANE